MTSVVHPKTVTDLATSLVGLAVGLAWSTLWVLLLVLVPATLIARSPVFLATTLAAAGLAVILAARLRLERLIGWGALRRISFAVVCAGAAALLSAQVLRAVVSP